MIKLVVFDLDGVLIDAKEIHYNALNKALNEVLGITINREEHLGKYDGLATNRKLELLEQEKEIKICDKEKIWLLKQQYTAKTIDENIDAKDYKDKLVILQYLRRNGYQVYCASNSIRDSIQQMLTKAGLIGEFSAIFSNEDVNHIKPHSQIYLKCMIQAGVNPNETLIVEDSPRGREAAYKSGAKVLSIKDSNDLTLNKIMNMIKNDKDSNQKWTDDKLNILIPMAGEGSRFKDAGYTFPKPLIEVNGKPMIQAVVENLNIDAHYIFLCQQSHYDKYNLKYLLNLIAPNCDIITINEVTEGAACTTLLAKKLIDNNNPLLVVNSDQVIEWDSRDFVYSSYDVDGLICTFESIHPKWSFAKTDKNNFVIEVAEKRPISNQATTGHYMWSKGSDYVKYAEQMIEKNIRINNEFYVCPVFNQAILDGKKIKTFKVAKMNGLGTPEDLNNYLTQNKRGNCEK